MLAPKFTITNAGAAALTKIERARGFLDTAKLSADWISEMQNRALLLEAHHTTHIEGTHLTLEESERLLAGKIVPGAETKLLPANIARGRTTSQTPKQSKLFIPRLRPPKFPR